MSHPPRVVLDTNVVVSALLFRGGPAARFRRAWHSQSLLPLASTATTRELMRVLAYPKFRMPAEDQRELLADYLPHATTVRVPDALAGIPDCRDPHDAAFLELAVAGRARFLVSGDRDLLALSGSVAFEIVSPADFLHRMDGCRPAT